MPIAVSRLLVAVAVLLSLVACGGEVIPAREVSGTVKGTASSPVDTGPTGQVATVVLADGLQIVAEVHAPAMVSAGQRVRVRETTGAVTGAKTYEVIGVMQTK